MNKPLVAVLVGLIALGTVNFVMAAAPGTIQNVFVTNWPRNQNVTVTNPPTVVVNVTVVSQHPAPKLLVLADNRSLGINLNDSYAFSTSGYNRLSYAFSSNSGGLTTAVLIDIYLKNGPAIGYSYSNSQYYLSNFVSTAYVIPAFYADGAVIRISNRVYDSSSPGPITYSLGVYLAAD